MSDYSVLAKRYTVYTAILIFLVVILAFFTTSSFYTGLLLGMIFSLVNLWSTYFQVKRLNESLEENKAKFSLGTLFRALTAVAAIFIAIQFPAAFDYIGVILGLMTTYIIILIEPLFQLNQLTREKR